AHPLDRQHGLVVLDETQADQRIVSRAKYAAARRRISVSVSSSITWRRRRFNSSRSDSVNASGSASRSLASRACLTQFHNVPSLIPSDRATSAIGRPELRTNSSASRRNLSGYLLGRAMTAPF